MNVVGLFVMLLSVIPVYIAQRLAGSGEGVVSMSAPAAEAAEP